MHCIHVLTGSPAWQTKAICSSLASRACINEVMAHWTESHDCLKARVLAAATGKDILAPGRFAPGSSSKKAFTLTRKDVRSRSYKPVLHGALLRFGMQPPPKRIALEVRDQTREGSQRGIHQTNMQTDRVAYLISGQE